VSKEKTIAMLLRKNHRAVIKKQPLVPVGKEERKKKRKERDVRGKRAPSASIKNMTDAIKAKRGLAVGRPALALTEGERRPRRRKKRPQESVHFHRGKKGQKILRRTRRRRRELAGKGERGGSKSR